jgi:hypothetical protein
MEVVVVNLRDVRVRDNDERKVSKSLYSVCESNWEEGEGEVCGREQSFCRERWSTVSAGNCISAVDR